MIYANRLRDGSAFREQAAMDADRLVEDFRSCRDRAPDGSDEKRYFEAKVTAAAADRDHALAIAKHYRERAEEMGRHER
jgi:hypothetical protein